MLYITQLIFIKPGQEATFLEFEEKVLPLMADYGGDLLYRLRPTPETFITATGEEPYEIHFIAFPSEAHLADYMQDDRRTAFVHLKEASIKSVLLVKGKPL